MGDKSEPTSQDTDVLHERVEKLLERGMSALDHFRRPENLKVAGDSLIEAGNLLLRIAEIEQRR